MASSDDPLLACVLEAWTSPFSQQGLWTCGAAVMPDFVDVPAWPPRLLALFHAPR